VTSAEGAASTAVAAGVSAGGYPVTVTVTVNISISVTYSRLSKGVAAAIPAHVAAKKKAVAVFILTVGQTLEADLGKN
jgi:hypothetical protein